MGLIVNCFHPRSVKITVRHPSVNYADGDILIKGSPDVNQSTAKTKTSEEDMQIADPVILSTEQVIELMTKDEAILIDARESEIYHTEHIPSSISIPFEKYKLYKSVMDTLSTTKWIVCYCDNLSCDLGELLAYEMIRHGFHRVAIYAEGIEAWKMLGNEVESGKGE